MSGSEQYHPVCSGVIQTKSARTMLQAGIPTCPVLCVLRACIFIYIYISFECTREYTEPSSKWVAAEPRISSLYNLNCVAFCCSFCSWPYIPFSALSSCPWKIALRRRRWKTHSLISDRLPVLSSILKLRVIYGRDSRLNCHLWRSVSSQVIVSLLWTFFKQIKTS